MSRRIEEVIASQRQMVQRLKAKGTKLDREQLARGLTAHREETLRWLATAPHMKSITIDYPALLQDPQSAVARLQEFLSSACLTTSDKMAAVIDPSLHRQKEQT